MSVRDPLVGHVNLASGFRGGERQTELLVRGLAAEGLTQRLVARAGQPLVARCADVPRLEIVATTASVMRAAGALRGVDLVHVHQGRSLRAAALRYLLTGTPYLVTRRVQQGPRPTAVNRWMYRHAATVVALSESIAGSLRRLDPSLEPQVIPSASSGLRHDPAAARQIREQCGGSFLVGHVGALDDSHKGQRQLVKLARRLESSAPDVRLLLVGGGRDEAEFRDAAASLGNFILAGQVDNVGDYLAAFDAFIYPSRHEGLGSILLDAMSFGLPVVATTVGGIPEIIRHEVNGFLCEVDDIDALYAAVVKLAGDRALCEQISDANRERSKQFDPSIMVDRYLRLYQRLENATR